MDGVLALGELLVNISKFTLPIAIGLPVLLVVGTAIVRKFYKFARR